MVVKMNLPTMKNQIGLRVRGGGKIMAVRNKGGRARMKLGEERKKEESSEITVETLHSSYMRRTVDVLKANKRTFKLHWF